MRGGRVGKGRKLEEEGAIEIDRDVCVSCVCVCLSVSTLSVRMLSVCVSACMCRLSAYGTYFISKAGDRKEGLELRSISLCVLHNTSGGGRERGRKEWRQGYVGED